MLQNHSSPFKIILVQQEYAELAVWFEGLSKVVSGKGHCSPKVYMRLGSKPFHAREVAAKNELVLFFQTRTIFNN